jgi:DNA-binding Lrp family transcriptional regulator
MTKIHDVYLVLAVTAGQDGQCRIRQTELARLVNLSDRHLRRLTRELIEIGLIRVFHRYNRYGRRGGMVYKLTSLPDIRSPVGGSPTGHQESGSDLLPDIRSPVVTPTGHQESGRGTHDHDMNDDEINKENLNLKLQLLDFFNEPGRSWRASKCSLDEARAWRAFRDYCDTHDLWSALGVRDNPTGWIYRLMENGQPPPPLQFPLPAGSLDLSGFRSRGRGRTEIEQPAGLAGAELGDDGMWR